MKGYWDYDMSDSDSVQSQSSWATSNLDLSFNSLSRTPSTGSVGSHTSTSSSFNLRLQPCIDIDNIDRESEEGKDIFDREHPISELLDGLHGEVSTSNWNSPFNDVKVRRHFKVQWQEVSTRELVEEHFFNGQSNMLQSWIAKPGVKNIMDYFENATITIDTDEDNIFFSSGTGSHRGSERKWAEVISAKATALANEPSISSRNFLAVDRAKDVSKTMSGGILLWLKFLEYVVQQDPVHVPERLYVDNIRMLMNCFGIVCMNGINEKLIFPETKLRCNPDLLFASSCTAKPNWAPLEAKSMILDPAFSRYSYLWIKANKAKSSMKGSHTAEEKTHDENDPCVQDCSSDEDSDATVIIEQDDEPEDKPSGSKRKTAGAASASSQKKLRRVSFSSTESDPIKQNKAVFLLLNQLLAQIVSLDSKNPSPNHRRIGIGVVGLRVIFITFYGKPGLPIQQVPMTKGGETEVHFTRPLRILNAKDRKEIARALLAIALHEN